MSISELRKLFSAPRPAIERDWGDQIPQHEDLVSKEARKLYGKKFDVLIVDELTK